MFYPLKILQSTYKQFADLPSKLFVLILVIFGLCIACKREHDEPPGNVLTISVEQHSSWIRNFNPFSPNARRFTRAGIYEPLMIYNSIRAELVPWLATKYQWNHDYTELTFTIRKGVLFSNGEQLTIEDVVFSFELLKSYPALDTGGLWSVIRQVESRQAQQVTLTLIEPFQPKLFDLAQHIVVPKSIWSQIKDPIAFTNPHPIGTGPFTEVSVFRAQVFELGKNPHYWRKGKPKIQALRFPAFPSNDQANLALVTGDVEWAGNFVPAIERTFVDPDRKHRQYWFPLVGSMVNLVPNTLKAPFNQTKVRQALSQAINRDKIVEIAMYGYTRPADSTGLSDGFSRFHDQQVSQDFTWTQYDVNRANALLKEAGLEKKQGQWFYQDEQGSILPLNLTIDVVSGWSDWVRAAQVIAHHLTDLGIPTKVRTSEFSSWFDRLQKGSFQLAIAWADDRSSPYEYYRWLLGSDTVKALGESTAGNFHRFGDSTADQILAKLKRGSRQQNEHDLVKQLQRRYAELTPAIPLFPNPQWGAVNTKNIVGFPSQKHPYAPLSPNREPECLLVFDQIRPRLSKPQQGAKP